MSIAEAIIAIDNSAWLRPMTDADLNAVLAWRNAPAVRANMYTTHVITPAEHAHWWSQTCDDPSRRYFIFETRNGAFGVVGFTRIGEIAGEAEWAFYASPDAPRGSGSKMEWLALEYAFGRLALQTLRCEVLETNTRVIELHTRFGFVTVGTAIRQIDQAREANIYRLALDRHVWGGLRQSALDRITSQQGPAR